MRTPSTFAGALALIPLGLSVAFVAGCKDDKPDYGFGGGGENYDPYGGDTAEPHQNDYDEVAVLQCGAVSAMTSTTSGFQCGCDLDGTLSDGDHRIFAYG